jgi:hypothetical protein
VNKDDAAPDYYAANQLNELEKRVDELETDIMGVQSKLSGTDTKEPKEKKIDAVERRVADMESMLARLHGDDCITVKLPIIALTRGKGGLVPAGYGPVPLQTCLNGVASQFEVFGTTPTPIAGEPVTLRTS